MPMVNMSPDYRTPQKTAAKGEAGQCQCDTYTGTDNGKCERCGKSQTRPISMVGGGRGGALMAFTAAQEAGR